MGLVASDRPERVSVTSASLGDTEAPWVGHRRNAPVHGFKAHVAADGDADIVWAVEVTPARSRAVPLVIVVAVAPVL